MKDRYRFDDAYRKVYEYDEDARAYIHIGSYLTFGITAKMSDKTKAQIVSMKMLLD